MLVFFETGQKLSVHGYFEVKQVCLSYKQPRVKEKQAWNDRRKVVLIRNNLF